LRHARPLTANEGFDARDVRRREVWYVFVVAIVFVLFLGTVLKQCSDEAPIPPDDISRSGQPAVAGVPALNL
jgi:hypothetical protein